MDALRRSIAEEKAAGTPQKKGHKRPKAQGEMLLPISGKRDKEPAIKSTRQNKAG
jgi:hypothetical protein